MYAVRRR